MITNKEFREVTSRTPAGTIVVIDFDFAKYNFANEGYVTFRTWHPYCEQRIKLDAVGIVLKPCPEYDNQVEVLFGEQVVRITRFLILEVI